MEFRPGFPSPPRAKLARSCQASCAPIYLQAFTSWLLRSAASERSTSYPNFRLTVKRAFPAKRFHDGSLFRDGSDFVMFRPPSLLASPIVPTAALTVAEQPRLLRPSTTCFVTSPCIGYANHPSRQLVVWGLTPHEIHSLVGCSSAIGI